MLSLSRPKPNGYAEGWGRRFPLSVQSLYVVELEGIVTHAPSKLYTCKTYLPRRRDAYCQPGPSALLTISLENSQISANLWKIPHSSAHVAKIIPTTNSSNFGVNVMDRSLDFPMLVFLFYHYLPYNSATDAYHYPLWMA